MESSPKNEKGFDPNYAETFARTTRAIDSDWGCRPFVYKEVAKLILERGGLVNGVIADIGGGEGKVARDLRDIGVTDPIVLMDNNPAMLEKARQEETRQPKDIEILMGDALNMPLTNGGVMLGLRVLVDGHWDTNQLDQGNKELSRVLNQNGYAIVAIPDPQSYIDQVNSGTKTPGVIVRNEKLEYEDNQDVELTLSNTDGKSVNIPAKMHTLERYTESFEKNGLEVVNEITPELDKEEMRSYRESWGANTKPFQYRIFVLKKKQTT